jgi:chloramphenicol 3-O-phosphotransferase
VSSIIFLHGTSSSGKSTLARALQARLDAPFWHYSIDHLRDSGVLPSARIKAGDFQWRDMRAAFFDGFHRSVAAFADRQQHHPRAHPRCARLARAAGTPAGAARRALRWASLFR